MRYFFIYKKVLKLKENKIHFVYQNKIEPLYCILEKEKQKHFRVLLCHPVFKWNPFGKDAETNAWRKWGCLYPDTYQPTRTVYNFLCHCGLETCQQHSVDHLGTQTSLLATDTKTIWRPFRNNVLMFTVTNLFNMGVKCFLSDLLWHFQRW